MNIISMTKPHGLTASEAGAVCSFAARFGLGCELGRAEGGCVFATLSLPGLGSAEGSAVLILAREARRVVVLDSAGCPLVDRADLAAALASLAALLPGCPRALTV